jgi:hypothetical protein
MTKLSPELGQTSALGSSLATGGEEFTELPECT